MGSNTILLLRAPPLPLYLTRRRTFLVVVQLLTSRFTLVSASHTHLQRHPVALDSDSRVFDLLLFSQPIHLSFIFFLLFHFIPSLHIFSLIRGCLKKALHGTSPFAIFHYECQSRWRSYRAVNLRTIIPRSCLHDFFFFNHSACLLPFISFAYNLFLCNIASLHHALTSYSLFKLLLTRLTPHSTFSRST